VLILICDCVHAVVASLLSSINVLLVTAPKIEGVPFWLVCRTAIFHFKDAFPHFIAECCRSALCGFSPFDQRRTGGRQVSKVRRRSLAPCAARSQLLRCLTRQKPKCSTRFVCIQYWSAYYSGAAPSSLCILYRLC
jgi:hypothetical protein